MDDRTCSINGCDGGGRLKRGLCTKHYQRWRRTGSTHLEERPTVCIIEGCGRPVTGHGWCAMHYLRWHRHGDPLYELDTETRFWSKVDKNGPVPAHKPELGRCWVWTAGLDDKDGGYGRFSVDGQPVGAHRFAYELLIRPIPEGLHLDHLCDNPPCCNPAHLDPVTCRENVLRGDTPAAANLAKTHCVNKHEFNEANTYFAPDGSRQCRTCNRDKERRRRAVRAACSLEPPALFVGDRVPGLVLDDRQ